MSGQTELQIWVVGISSLIGGFTDLKDRKLYNWLTFPLLFGGVLFSILSQRPFESLLGAAVGFGLLLPLYLLRGVGAGDVKFLMGLGAWMGPRTILEVAFLTLALGAIYGALDLLRKGKMLSFVRRIFSFFRSLAIKELEPESLRVDPTEKIPLGAVMALAAIWTEVSHPALYFWESFR